MTKKTLVLAAAAAFALPQAALAQEPAPTQQPTFTQQAVVQPVAATTDPAAATAPAAVAPASTAYPAASYPPPMPGAVAGSVAADRDGDGVIDGYYTSDGIYHPNQSSSLPPPRLASRRGERG